MSDPASFPIVGIGASAGGLQALDGFFRAMPVQSGMALVIIMHLAPDRTSLLTEILARHTGMNVVTAADGQLVEAERVYVMPPGVILTIAGRRLQIEETALGHHERAPIDIFFRSLAEDCGELAVGIILSGSGSDGMLGVKAIKQNGGVTLAQTSDPSGPGYAGMPDSAIASGFIDFALPVELMPEKLIDNLHKFDALEVSAESTQTAKSAISEARSAIYKILRDQAGHDFSSYKIHTFLRRVHRRMDVKGCGKILDYVELLRRDPAEAPLLFRDLLINVTSFFRDAAAFKALEDSVIPRLFEGRAASDSIRIWAPGCSTGEEVYSIAMLIREYAMTLSGAPRATIFATDIDDEALIVARAGCYPEARMTGVSPERRARFFKAESGGYRISKDVRDLCVFSSHSLLRDPPFSKIDLVSCRNLLIYFNTEAQRRALTIFYYALRPRGYLFLGMSETLGPFSEFFAPLDKEHCLFQAGRTGLDPHTPAFSLRDPLLFRPIARGTGDLRHLVETQMTERFSPPHVVVNLDGDIVYFAPRTSKYLEAAAGAPSRQLATMARKGLRFDVRTALQAAIETRRSATRQNISFETDDNRAECVSVTVAPLPERSRDQPLFLVLFNAMPALENTEPSHTPQSDAAETAQAGREFRDSQDHLQATIEEYETTLEELRSANEELVSLNEEMQSTNEELESSKEEMLSLNEELQTLNEELKVKIDDLDRSNSDLKNEFATMEIATIFLDRNLVIRNFSPAAAQIFSMIPTDRGRPLTDLVGKLDYPELPANLRQVLETGALIERQTRAREPGGSRFLARLLAYRNRAQQIDGVVAAFFDVTRLTRAEEEVQTLQANRAMAMRALALELAHEIRQPLTSVGIYLSAVRKMLTMPANKRPARIEDTLDKAIEQVEWAAKIVSHLRNFAPDADASRTLCCLHDLIRQAVELVSLSAKNAQVQLILRLDAKSDLVLADSVQIKQVLVNMIRNSVEAMNSCEERKLTISSALIEGSMIQIDATDTGVGISNDIAARMFEANVTTKPGGAGVGLALSRAIITSHGGTICAANNKVSGATVSFTLPLAEAK